MGEYIFGGMRSSKWMENPRNEMRKHGHVLRMLFVARYEKGSAV